MTPFVQDVDLTIHVGDALEVLRGLPDESVHCCVTSPPYWGLRDYGTGSWDGGDPDCEHSVGGQVEDTKAPGAIVTGQRPGVDASRCRKCGASRVDRQLGLEATPEEYVATMVAVFAEVRRVLRADGTCWLNLGDSYAGSWGAQSRGNETGEDKTTLAGASMLSARQIEAHPKGTLTGSLKNTPGLKQKDLVGIPWRVAFALQADGWYLRSDIVWSKPNPMPESVTDRPTKSHEYVFLLTKSARYFYDADAIAEPASWYGPNGQPKAGPHAGQMKERAGKRKQDEHENRRYAGFNDRWDASEANGTAPLTRNARSVWSIQTQQFAEAHFAVFPEEIPRRCILAGCPVGGTVFDPFGGSGTTAVVARAHGRRCILIELSEKYAALAADRTRQLSLLAGEASA